MTNAESTPNLLVVDNKKIKKNRHSPLRWKLYIKYFDLFIFIFGEHYFIIIFVYHDYYYLESTYLV